MFADPTPLPDPLVAPLPCPQLGIGRVRHLRLRPVRHQFDYPTWFLLLPLRRLREQPVAMLRRNRRGWVSLHDADHGAGRGDCLAWADALQQAEVNNTFGGRHSYLLTGTGLAFGQEMVARKLFQVSPFCQIEGRYRFRFMRTGLGATGQADGGAGRTVARIEHDAAQGPLLLTSVSGDLAPLTPPHGCARRCGACRCSCWAWCCASTGRRCACCSNACRFTANRASPLLPTLLPSH